MDGKETFWLVLVQQSLVLRLGLQVDGGGRGGKTPPWEYCGLLLGGPGGGRSRRRDSQSRIYQTPSVKLMVEGHYHTNSSVENSLNNFNASSSVSMLLVWYTLAFPGFSCASLLNCRQFAIKEYKTPFDTGGCSSFASIGLTRN